MMAWRGFLDMQVVFVFWSTDDWTQNKEENEKKKEKKKHINMEAFN